MELEDSAQTFSDNDKEEGGERISLYDTPGGAERLRGKAINHDRKESS